MTDTQQPQQQQNSQYEGTSNAEEITSTETPNSNNSTVATASAASAPPSTPSTPDATQNGSGGASKGQTVATATGQPQDQTPAEKKPDLSKPAAPGTPVVTTPPPQTPPQLSKASVFHQVAETLAGGPRFSYKVDEYGNLQKEKVPVSNGHLALAIAMEALGGAAAGLGVPSGPNATGRAAAAGFAHGEKQVQQQDEQARKQATDDFGRRAQVTETNMRMYMMAKQIGKLDEETNKNYIEQFKPMADNLLKNYSGFVEGPVSYKDFAKYNVTQNNAIPYQQVPRLDSNGKQVINNGVPQYDINYLIVKPGLKATNLMGEEDVKSLQEMGMLPKGSAADLIVSTPMQLMQALNLKSSIAAWNVGGGTYDTFHEKADSFTSGKTAASAPNAPTITPKLPDPNVESVATQMAQQYNVPDALVKGIIAQESGGNANTPDSHGHVGGGSRGGAMGVMQLMPETAKQYGVTDPHNVQQNIEGGVKYLADLLDPKKYPNINGDPKLAMAAYIGGPGVASLDHKLDLSGKSEENKKAITKYVDDVSTRIGLGLKQEAKAAKQMPEGQPGTVGGQQNPDTRMSLKEWNTRYPRTRSDNEKLLSALSQTDNNYSEAFKYLDKEDHDAAVNMMAFLGGPDAISAHDTTLSIEKDQRKTDEAVRKTQEVADLKQKSDMKTSDYLQSFLKEPDNFVIPGDIGDKSMEDTRKELEANGVKTPSSFPSLWGVAHYHEKPETFFPKVWTKGSPYEMDAQTAKSYIRQFLNPDYDDTRFEAARTTLKEAVSGNAKTGAAIQNAGTAAQHLEMLRQAIPALKGNDIQAINRIAQSIGVATGNSAPLVMQAIAEKVTQEVEKVAAGGTVPYKEQLADGKAKLSSINSPEQLEGVIKAYTGLMAGRIKSIDDNFYSVRGEHLFNVSKEATALFKRYGFDTSWKPDPKPPTLGAIGGRDPVTGEIVAWKLPDGSIQYINSPQQHSAEPAGSDRAQSLVNNLRSQQ